MRNRCDVRRPNLCYREGLSRCSTSISGKGCSEFSKKWGLHLARRKPQSRQPGDYPLQQGLEKWMISPLTLLGALNPCEKIACLSSLPLLRGRD
jgi:hypothetical protein